LADVHGSDDRGEFFHASSIEEFPLLGVDLEINDDTGGGLLRSTLVLLLELLGVLTPE
jgi:hypothetical protein